ncbi:hypothetical protein SAMN04487857_101346 [Pseudomonas sp. ok272]|uniref:DUF7683 domain-containing protein n=1 Tax=unclassified Pseudomonas TaxID=196821 RepID=UPI0008C1F7AE|nr:MULTISPECIES: hypothetical protein [unclassified Pseudomonas]SEM36092.1 hypothetical protein SAMN04487857_101346 [Pseudomonas sp. ok272]SFM36445.1 hypothetical protein SAMN04487858_102348 [Pseudomonas sp. ok602]
MKHVIEVFDKNTEELLLSVEIPGSRSEALKKLMNWQYPGDEYDGYDLSSEQVKILEDWTGRNLDDANHLVQLVCTE